MHTLDSNRQSHKQLLVSDMTSPKAPGINSLPCLPRTLPYAALDETIMEPIQIPLFWIEIELSLGTPKALYPQTLIKTWYPTSSLSHSLYSALISPCGSSRHAWYFLQDLWVISSISICLVFCRWVGAHHPAPYISFNKSYFDEFITMGENEGN